MRADMATYAETLADYTHSLCYADLPDDVAAQGKRVLLDSVACGIASALVKRPWCEAALSLVLDQKGKESATIWHFGGRVPEANAAFVNGMFAHGMDFSDDLGGVQIGGIVPTAALAVGEACHASGREVIAATVIGYDVAARMAETLNSEALYLRGLQPTSILGGFAAVAASGRLMGLTVDQQAHAFGIVASYSGGTMEFLEHGTDTKRLHPARCAHAGVVSAQLAQRGMSGPRTIFEGEFGFLNAFSSRPNASKLTADLGKRFEILNTSIKPLPFCDGNFAPLEGALKIVRENRIKVQDIAAIHCRVIPSLIPYVFEFHGDRERKFRPVTDLDAQMSLPYCLAVGLLNDGDVWLDDFDSSKYGDPAILEVARKVTVEADKSLLGETSCPITLSGHVVLTTNQGQRFEEFVLYQHGDPRNPLDDNELFEKFMRCTQKSLSRDRAEQVVSALLGLESVPDVRSITSLLVCDRAMTETAERPSRDRRAAV
jgi:2-methylcitrate dehydratase PrpD